MSLSTNSREYWDYRFASGDWEQCQGRWQTTSFAEKQVQLLRLPSSFDGTLLDFGCGLGDALTVYRKHFPSARLIGIDISAAAISQCRKKYGHIATFSSGGYDSVPQSDVIVASNVIEHIKEERLTVEALLSKCTELYVFVPYMENPLCSEHVNYYDDTSFAYFKTLEVKSYYSRGWTQYGRGLWIDTYLKNLLRPFLGKPLVRRRKQIMFRMRGAIRSGRLHDY
mgnify:CR=1 FL=1